jgi:hypothetical protein
VGISGLVSLPARELIGRIKYVEAKDVPAHSDDILKRLSSEINELKEKLKEAER